MGDNTTTNFKDSFLVSWGFDLYCLHENIDCFIEKKTLKLILEI